MSWTAVALRPLLLVVAVLGLLGSGGVELAPRTAGAPAVSVLASAAGPAASRATPPTGAPVHRADGQAPATVSRAGYAAMSVPSSGGSDLPPATGPLVALHLTAARQSRPPTAPHLGSAHDAAAGRAPPTTTGT